MAVVGDAVYNLMNGVPLYVSSNAYYGYVPPSSRASASQDFNYQHEAGQRNDFSHKGATRNHCGYGLAMETDADSYENSEGARCINNPCVIPEVSRRLTVGHREDGHEHLRERRTIHDAASRCRNRKRNSEDLALFAPMKRFREGGGNNRDYYHGARVPDPEEYRPVKVHYEPAPLRLSNAEGKSLVQPSATLTGCVWAAGNYNSLSNTVSNGLLPLGCSEAYEDDAEFEKMLLETHGCSVHQLRRQQQLLNDSAEAEF